MILQEPTQFLGFEFRFRWLGCGRIGLSANAAAGAGELGTVGEQGLVQGTLPTPLASGADLVEHQLGLNAMIAGHQQLTRTRLSTRAHW